VGMAVLFCAMDTGPSSQLLHIMLRSNALKTTN